MKSTYSFREGSRLRRDRAEAVGDELERLTKENGGLTAECVVAAADSKDSPLHEFFEWNHKKAARAYRLEQARHLIRSVVVIYEPAKDAGPIRAYIAFEKPSADLDDEGRYVSIQRILSDAELREQLVDEALEEHKRWELRWKHIEEVRDLIVAGERLQADLRQRRLRARQKAKKGKGRKLEPVGT